MSTPGSTNGRQRDLRTILPCAGAFYWICSACGVAAAVAPTDETVTALSRSIPQLTSDVQQHVEELQESTWAYRREGDFENALASATEVWQIRSKWQGENWWEAVEWAHMVELLGQIQRMPREAQCRLAETYEDDEHVYQLLEERNYSEAIATLHHTLEVRRSLLGAEHWEVGHVLSFLGRAYYEASDLSNAESFLRMASAVYNLNYCAEYPAKATSLLNLGKVLCDRKSPAFEIYEEAVEYCEVARQIYDRTLGPETTRVALCLRVIGTCLVAISRFDLAEQRMRQAVAIHEASAEADYREYVRALEVLSMAVFLSGRKEEGLAIQQSALEIFKSKIPDDDYGLAARQQKLAVDYDRMGKYDAAQPLYEAALETVRRVLPPDHINVAENHMAYAFFLHRVGLFANAEKHFRAALPIVQAKYGTYHWQTALILGRLAVSLRAKGDFKEAEQMFLEVERIYDRMADEQDRYRVDNLRNLATLYVSTGDYAAAETLYRRVLVATEGGFGRAHYRFAIALRDLGYILLRKGQLGEAERLLKQAIKDARQAYGTEEHTDVAWGLWCLAEVLVKRGDLVQAEEVARKAVRLFEKLHDARHSDHVVFWNRLTSVLLAADKADEAAKIARRSLQFAKDANGKDSPAVGAALLTLGQALEADSDLEKAEDSYRSALKIYRKFMGNHHMATAQSLHHLATLYRKEKDFGGALPLYREAFDIVEQKRSQIIGDERSRAAFAKALDMKSLSNELANLLIKLGDAKGALTVLERGRGRALLDLLSRSEQDLPARLREEGDTQRAHELEAALQVEKEALFAMRSAEARVRVAFDSEKTRQGAESQLYHTRLEEAAAARRAYGDAEANVFALLREAWPDAKPLAADEVRSVLEPGDLMAIFSETDEAVSLLLVPALGEGHIEAAFVAQGQSEVERYRALAKNALKDVTHRQMSTGQQSVDISARLALFERLFPATVRDRVLQCRRLVLVPDGVVRRLPVEALAVDSGGTSSRHPALLIDVGPAVVYADSATVYANRVGVGRSRRPDRDGAAVSALVVGGPDFRQPHQTVDYPDQGLVVSNVEPEGTAERAGLQRGDVLLTYADSRLESADALAAAVADEVDESVPNDNEHSLRPIAVKYWRKGEVRETLLHRGALGVRFLDGPPAAALSLQRMASRSVAEGAAEVSALDQIRLYGGTLTPLAGARSEAKVLGQLFRATGGQADVFLGSEATIANVESHVSGKRYVHLATHGIVGSEANPYDASLALTQPETPTPEDFGFLTLDHLVRDWQGKLSGCDLVVLSACDSTKGVKTGDSLIALPWGFMYAGAPAVVASLWKVDDTATTLLMKRFYQNLLGHYSEGRHDFAPGTRMPKAEALREAKNWLRSLPPSTARELIQRGGLAREPVETVSVDQVYNYAHPYYWASFVLIGAPD